MWWVYRLESQGSNKCVTSFSKPFKRLMSPEPLSWANDALLSKPELERPSVTFSLSDSVAWPCSTLQNVCQKQLFCPERNREKQRETHTDFYENVCLGWKCSKAFFPHSTRWKLCCHCSHYMNKCFPTCTCELIGFCNIPPSPWPSWRPRALSLGSVNQDLLHFHPYHLARAKGNCRWLLTCGCQFCEPQCNYIESSRRWGWCNVYLVLVSLRVLIL